MKLAQFRSCKSDSKMFQALKKSWLRSLTAPQDDMWESFMDRAEHWVFTLDQHEIGYACVNQNNELIQFYLEPLWLIDGHQILRKFLADKQLSKAIVGTNNPIFLSAALHQQVSVKIHSYLFQSVEDVKLHPIDGLFRAASLEDIENLINFCHKIHPASREWLMEYISTRVTREEYFLLMQQAEILGTCEVRKSDSNPSVANLGMMVSADHRGKGLGTFLLGKAKEISLQWNRQPICSCSVDNTGSVKAITRNGFRSIHQILSIKFTPI